MSFITDLQELNRRVLIAEQAVIDERAKREAAEKTVAAALTIVEEFQDSIPALDRLALERLLAAGSSGPHSCSIHCTKPACVARRELAELREDKARLDWMEETRSCALALCGDDNNGNPTRHVWEVGNVDPSKYRDTLRAAIDAARKEGAAT